MSDKGGRGGGSGMGWIVTIVIVVGLNLASWLFDWGWYFW